MKSSTDGDDRLPAEVRNLNTTGLIAAQDLGGIFIEALQNTGVIALASPDHHDVTRLCVSCGNGISERAPRFGKARGLGWLTTGLFGDDAEEVPAPWGFTWIDTKDGLEGFVVFTLVESRISLSLIEHASRHRCSESRTDRSGQNVRSYFQNLALWKHT